MPCEISADGRSGVGMGPGAGSSVIGGQNGSRVAGPVRRCWGRPAWVSISWVNCSMSARVGCLCPVVPVLRLSIIIRHSYGCRLRTLPFETGGSWRGTPPACLACMRCDPASGCTPQDVWSCAPRYTLGLDARRRFSPRFFFGVCDAYLYRFDLKEKV
jgi:hypothetical protein